MTEYEVPSYDYFTGAVPAYLIFQGKVDSLRELIIVNDSSAGGLNPAAEVCLIGLVAYFEAFCKDHFASLMNICPQLLSNLRSRGQDVRVDAVSLLVLDNDPKHNLGFLIAESRNFGTAKEINGHYRDLISITPFSRDEKVKFDQLLNDRNLLVHHGGIYTARYAEQTFATRTTGEGRVFLDSLVIGKDQVLSAADFLSSVAAKLTESTQSALKEFIEAQNIEQSAENKKALDSLTWGLNR